MSQNDKCEISNEMSLMQLAITEMKKSTGKRPKVGAVLVKNGEIISTGFKGPKIHAERDAIEKALKNKSNIKNATLYTTLEPCIRGSQNTQSCSELIIENKISTVIIGAYDPNPVIYRKGWRDLVNSNIIVKDFPANLRSEIDNINTEFTNQFEKGIGPSSGAKFDYELNDGKFEIEFSESDSRTIITRWTKCGINAIYADARYTLGVALAKYATEFGQIDDPTALELKSSTRVGVGEIAIFRTSGGCALVKVLSVESGLDYGSENTLVKIKYQIRPF